MLVDSDFTAYTLKMHRTQISHNVKTPFFDVVKISTHHGVGYIKQGRVSY